MRDIHITYREELRSDMIRSMATALVYKCILVQELTILRNNFLSPKKNSPPLTHNQKSIAFNGFLVHIFKLQGRARTEV